MTEPTKSTHLALLPFLGVLRIGARTPPDSCRQLTHDTACSRTAVRSFRPAAPAGRSWRCSACARLTTRSTHCCPRNSRPRSPPRSVVSCCAPKWICRSRPTCRSPGWKGRRSPTRSLGSTTRRPPRRPHQRRHAARDDWPVVRTIAPGNRERVAGDRHRGRPAAGVCGDVGFVRAADAEPGPARRDQLHQGLLYRPGNRRAHAAPRPNQAPDAALSAAAGCGTRAARRAFARRAEGRGSRDERDRDDAVELLAVTSLEAAGRTLVTDDGREAVPVALPYELDGSA